MRFTGRTKQKVALFLGAHMLRRLKEEVVDDLVSKTEEVLELQFDEAEEDVYKAFQNHARTRFNRFVRAGTAKKNYAHILVLLLRLRQICDHPYLAMKVQDGTSESVGDEDQSGGEDANGDGDESKDPLEKLDAAVLRRLNDRTDSILDSECPICLDVFNEGIMFPKCGHMICKEHLYDLQETCPECRGKFRVSRVIAFSVIVKSALVDEKHKKSLLANDGKDGLVMDGNTIAERMGASPVKSKGTTRRIIWRKVSRAKGEFRRDHEKKADLEEEKERERERGMDSEDAKKKKLEKMQKKFDWNTYTVDKPFNAEFEDDDGTGYGVDDKYPNPDNGWDFMPSSKTKMIMQKIQSIRKHYPNDKIIVFSQFVQAIRILERVMHKYKYRYLVYEGSMTRDERKETVQKFKNDAVANHYPVMIMSLKTAALGLNLTVANHVIFTDLWWNPAVELQAIDRVHRIGQKKHVHVTRMVIKDSVEERLLALQRQKQEVADSALDGANFMKKQRLSLQDLAKLFGSEQSVVREAQQSDAGFNRNSLMNVRNASNHNHNHMYS